MAASTPTTTPASTSAANPAANQGLLIAAWITAILVPLVGLIISIIGKNKGDARFKAPMIVSIILLVLGVLWFVFVSAAIAGAANA
ncbi:MAG TPA: hypothetical protein VFH47_01300 [Candidatus Thermoplasmatota archaeon]|nr:hypothetical protein [Candidatus Thermoplasmatota archaeon]